MKKKGAKFWAIVAIALMLISMIGASLVQTSGGKVKVSEVKWATTDGYNMGALLLVPETATAETPAPAVVCAHGMSNNKEMQEANFIELSRRGYVVLSIDMYSHGASDVVPNAGTVLNSVWQGVLFLKDINYVDDTRIGVTGHSFGGGSCSTAVALDNANGTRYIAAVLTNSMEPTFDSDGDGVYDNLYGDRDAGLIACQYDEIGFRTYDSDGNELPRKDYYHSANAQSFLYFGTDPTGQPEREANTIYTENINGREAMRVIYTPKSTHPWSHFSPISTADTIEFFEQSLGAPDPISSDNQIWRLKSVFTGLGIVGFFMFMINITTILLDVPVFRSLKAQGEVKPAEFTSKKSKAMFWISLVLCVAFGAAMYLPIVNLSASSTVIRPMFKQTSVFDTSMWAAGCGIFAILCMVVMNKIAGKDEKVDCKAVGIKISGINLLKTFALAIIVVSCCYVWVFFADYFFHTDFRVWTLGIKAFEPLIIELALPFIIIIFLYYITNSVSVNCFNFKLVAGKEWLNTLILCLSVFLPVAIVIAVQYGYFFATGYVPFPSGSSPIIRLFPLVVLLPVSVLVSRKVYKQTRNPYLPGIICAIVVALISCANTSTFY